MELDSDLELKRRFDAIVNGLKPSLPHSSSNLPKPNSSSSGEAQLQFGSLRAGSLAGASLALVEKFGDRSQL
jgi:hypothetical protein